jgi:hypothetical protein
VPAARRRLIAPNASKIECLLFMVVAPFSRWTNDSAVMVIETLGNPLISDGETPPLRGTQPVRCIAARLGIASKTVDTYRGRLLAKLHLRSTAELIRFAILNGNGLDGPADRVCGLVPRGREVLPAPEPLQQEWPG